MKYQLVISIKIHVEKNDNCQGVKGDCLINNNHPPFKIALVIIWNQPWYFRWVKITLVLVSIHGRDYIKIIIIFGRLFNLDLNSKPLVG
jgi:hypothetical protein